MAFSEEIKNKIRIKANNCCCVCQLPFPDIHHIIPLKDGGTDDIENAAPLCPTHHRWYGNNPDLRKALILMRDEWYGKCARVREELPEIIKRVGHVEANTNRLAEELKAHDDKVEDRFQQHLTAMSNLISQAISKLPPTADSAWYASGVAMSIDMGSTEVYREAMSQGSPSSAVTYNTGQACSKCGRPSWILKDGLCIDCVQKSGPGL